MVRRPDWRVVAYIVILLTMMGALAWGIANCGCQNT